MLREHVELIRSSLVVADSHSASMRIYRCTQRGTLLRLLAGIYIPRSLLEGRSPVDFREITFIARVCALGLRYPDYVISGAVAAYILDLPCESRIERLTLYTPSRQCPNLVHFPEIVIDDNMRIPSARISTCRPSHPVSSIEYLGFRIATPARVLVDCARLLSDKRGHVSLIVSTRKRRGTARMRHAGSFTRPWMTLHVTPEDAGTPDGSSTTLTLDASLPARPWSSSLCCTRASMGWQHRKKSTLTATRTSSISHCLT